MSKHDDTMRRTLAVVVEAAHTVSKNAEKFYDELEAQGLIEYAGGIAALVDGFREFGEAVSELLFEELSA